MSSKKEKFIENAQKLIIKGQFEKAVFELEQAIALDPGDLKVRQKLAEILIRVNRQSEAISHYETIGKSFSNSGFYLKAIAVYKQIQKLDPENTKTTITLAELNVNHGLIGNALAEYSQVVNVYLKCGKQAEALQLLERMLEVDPSNLNTMLKIAETLLAADKIDEAFDGYCRLARQLWERPDKSAYNRLNDRIKTLFPGKGDPILSSISALLERGESADAFVQLKEIISLSPDNLAAWYLMADAIRNLGDTRQLKGVLARISERFPAEIRAKEELITLLITFQELDSVLDLLDQYGAFLAENGHADQVANYYNQLQVLAPQDTRPVAGLCRLFEKTGDSTRLAEAQELLAKLNKQPEAIEPVDEGIQPIEEMPLTPVGPDSSDIGHSELSESIPPEPQALEWEEEIDLGFEEEPEPQTVILPTPMEVAPGEPEVPEELPEFLPELLSTEPEQPWQQTTDTAPLEAAEPEVSEVELSHVFAPEELAEALGEDAEPEDLEPPEDTVERVILTIESPLPVEAFLEPAIVETMESPVIEQLQVSPWDEIAAEEPVTADIHGEQSDLAPADELMDLLVGHLESFDWTATDNRVEPQAQTLQAEELEFEVLADAHDENSEPPSFELEDLSSFAEALFSDEPATADAADDSEQYSLGSLISAFRKGVDEQLDDSDTESHYNLGIAYKEMGLLDEAIHEFRSAGRDPQRAADCIALQGLCLREKGDTEGAESVFRAGLELPVLSSEALLNLKYELSQLLEQSDRHQEAVTIYKEIVRVNPSYRDVSLHLARLSDEEDLDILIELHEEGN
ncbi:tetratricopeptide repeat protein [Geobacter pelophilus]|uniref:Tetratricopeptide repeat protein n=1 Tax=Geoanaerobacter pelophilus TaxID=60036 RepID=A0AAW4L7M4_9BACT|nr:tetratricopeptide repeat protein [Geoanaerobacter pelophilus]MBT0665850.1 tetratricopeptide repeat protein [Geoanaerobacter pelophilus]